MNTNDKLQIKRLTESVTKNTEKLIAMQEELDLINTKIHKMKDDVNADMGTHSEALILLAKDTDNVKRALNLI